MPPMTLRLARINVELSEAAAALFTRPERRRHLSVIEVQPRPENGHLPLSFSHLPGLAPYDRERKAA